MQIGISVQFVFDIPLTEKHVTALSTLSRHHYDVRCKLASNDNGFLTGWRRMIEADTAAELEVSPLRVTWEQLDTCLKLLEMRYIASALLSDEQIDLCHAMNQSFWGAIRLASSKYDEWQAIYGEAEQV